MGFVKEYPIPADGVELLKAHDLWTEDVAYRNDWVADRERERFISFLRNGEDQKTTLFQPIK